MAVLCTATDSHIVGTNLTFPSSNQPISFLCWMSGVWSNPAVVQSFVGIYGPTLAAPTVAIQIGNRTVAGSCQVWTFGGGQIVNTPGGVMVDNRNHMIVYTCDGSTANIYIDGVLEATAAVTMPVGQYTNFYINGYPTGLTNETSTHTVDSVRLYNRVLSAPEVLTIFNSRGSRHTIVNGLLAHYDFDEGGAGSVVSTCVDYEGNSPLVWTGAGTTMTYTYPNAESKLRPVL